MTSDNSTQNTMDNSGTSQSSDNTVIFMHQRQGSESSKLQSTVATTSTGKLILFNHKKYYIILKNLIF